MPKAKRELLQRMAKVGLRAHTLYQVEVDLRDAALSLAAVTGDHDIADELRTLAGRLGSRRRREVIKHMRESAGQEGK